jgi:hypothetical protein
VSISSAGRWAEGRWRPGADETVINSDLTIALRASGAVYAYSRNLGDTGSITVMYARRPASGAEPSPAP